MWGFVPFFDPKTHGGHGVALFALIGSSCRFLTKDITSSTTFTSLV